MLRIAPHPLHPNFQCVMRRKIILAILLSKEDAQDWINWKRQFYPDNYIKPELPHDQSCR